MPCRSAGTAVLRAGYMAARYADTRHHMETKANWARVRVTGLGNAIRIDFEEVLVRAEVVYQMIHRI